VWELYNCNEDWTQARDLSQEEPQKLHELQRLFLIEATRNNVLPLDDRSFERVLPEVAGRPTTLEGNKQVLLPGMSGLLEFHLLNWRNRSWSLTSELELADEHANGVILNMGGHSGGWSFYLKDGQPSFCYNLFGISETVVRGESVAPKGTHQVRVEFAYDGGGLGKGGDVTLFVDGSTVGSGHIATTEPIGFGYEFTDVGRDALSPVTDDYAPDTKDFTNSIHWVEMETGSDSHDHLIDPERVMNFAMARQ
jgi:arylsulfatase